MADADLEPLSGRFLQNFFSGVVAQSGLSIYRASPIDSCEAWMEIGTLKGVDIRLVVGKARKSDVRCANSVYTVDDLQIEVLAP
jgi:hypothetical protein